METNQSFPVEHADSGQRLDLFLAEKLRLSRAQTRRLLARGAVSIAGRVLEAQAKGLALREGESVEVAAFTRPESQQILAEPDAPLAVLAEGEGWLVLDKPAGMPVHPLEPDERGTLLGAVVARHPELQGVGEGALRSGVVHRLDVDTSGALLVATTEPVWQRLRAAFAEHRVEKVYRAIVMGQVEGGGRIELPLMTARHRPAKVRAAKQGEESRGAKLAETSWRVIEVFADATLLEVRPVTGFLHQVRATFAELGHPLAGDRIYGGPRDATGAARHMLHAASLAFEEISAESPEPEDFRALLASLREPA